MHKRVQRRSPAGLWAVVCYVLGGARSAVGQHELCTGSLATVKDGVCDISNNVLSCRFDGGDCCPSTCLSSAGLCTEDPRQCLDPLALDYPYGEFGDCISISGNLPYIQDGESVLSVKEYNFHLQSMLFLCDGDCRKST